MYRPSSHRLRLVAPRVLAATWLWLFASVWALLPALDARADHGRAFGRASAAIERSQASTHGSALALGDSCELCDLLHSCGGTPVVRGGAGCGATVEAGRFAAPDSPVLGAAVRLAPARGPPAA